MNPSRKAQLAENLSVVRTRISEAAHQSGRVAEDITLVVVTKFFPASDVHLLAELGVTDVGENKHQEAQEKIAQCAGVPVRWHYIGGLQSNKAAQVAQYADVVHSVDRAKLVPRLAQGASGRGKSLEVLIQVSLDGASGGGSGRHGADPREVPDLAARIAQTEHLELRGLMAVAPLGADPRPAFAELAGFSEQLRAEYPAATWISAGMSGDLEAAISAGATHVRVGSGILGQRPEMK
jgi:pyridoxal phosphate enzyme (YggS family)